MKLLDQWRDEAVHKGNTDCKSSVEKALLKVPGVNQAEVDLVHKQAFVIGPADHSILVKAVNEAGYKVIDN
ncbi:MAG TPA: cation transporter [Desulfosporosinus sp.]|nr:cation transporter [Desulfosporosinus sp.]